MEENTKKQFMIAIVIPYYKLTFFEATLQSLANQTNKHFKVYIGDDASPEDCTALLQKHKGQFNFTYKRFESNLGSTSLVKQWERCIALSGEEEWLMILGDDDYLGDNVVEAFYNNYSIFNGKSNVIRFATKVIIEETEKVSEAYMHPIWESASHSYFRRFKGLTRSSLSEYIFHKGAFNKYGFCDYPLAWHSDDSAWLEFSENKPIYSINESVIFFRISEINITGKKNNIALKNLATEQFFKKSIVQNLSLFNKKQRLVLLLEFEIVIKKNRKLYTYEWLYLLNQYLIVFKPIPFIKCVRRFLKSNLKS